MIQKTKMIQETKKNSAPAAEGRRSALGSLWSTLNTPLSEFSFSHRSGLASVKEQRKAKEISAETKAILALAQNVGIVDATRSALGRVRKDQPAIYYERLGLAVVDTINQVVPLLLASKLVTSLSGGFSLGGCALAGGLAGAWALGQWTNSHRDRIIQQFQSYACRSLEDKLIGDVMGRSHATLRSPGFNDVLRKLREQFYRVVNFTQRNFDFFSSGTACLIAGGAIAGSSPAICAAFFLSGTLHIYSQLRHAQEFDRTEDKIADQRRMYWYERWYSVVNETVREFKNLLKTDYAIKRVASKDVELIESILDDMRRHSQRLVRLGALATTVKVVALGSLMVHFANGSIPGSAITNIVFMGIAFEGAIASLSKSLGEHAKDLSFARIAHIISQVGTADRIPGKVYQALSHEKPPLIKVENVHLQTPHGDKEILKGVSFTLEPGKVYGFCGDSGAGKTSLIRMLMLEQMPSQGGIIAEGIKLGDVDPTDWRAVMGYLCQDYHSFDCYTVADSVELGRPEGGQIGVSEALERSAVDFLPEGLQARIGEDFDDGRNFSGGERQRLALARIISHGAKVIILDEPSAKLGVVHEKLIFGDLLKLSQSACPPTRVIISHRFANLMEADQIFYMEDGLIVERGTHAELMQQNGNYAKRFLEESSRYHRSEGNSFPDLDYLI